MLVRADSAGASQPSEPGASVANRDAKEKAEQVERNWAVVIIQSAFVRKRLHHDLALFITEMGLDEDDLVPPSLATARSFADRKLLRNPATNSLYSLRAPLSVFDSMGVEVATYMRFIVYTGRFMAFCTLLNASNLVINLDGGQADNDLLSKLSINNAVCPTNAHGAIELFTSLATVLYLFWARRQMFQKATQIRKELHENRVVSAANFSVMVDDCPAQTSAADLRRMCSRFGTVLHVGVALNNRGLLHHVARRQSLMLSAHEATTELISAVRHTRGVAPGGLEQRRAQKRMERARVSLEHCASVLATHDARLQKQLSDQRHTCVGKAFVTFNRSDTARSCQSAATGELLPNDGRPPGGLATVVRFRAPPDPSQVLWDNLQFSRCSQWLRQLLSTAVVLVFIIIGCGIISAANIAKPYIEIAVLCERAATNHTGLNYTSVGRSSSLGGALGPRGEWTGTFWPSIGNGCDVPPTPVPQCNLGLFETLPVLLGSTVALIFGHVIIFILVPVLASTVERPHFTRQREVSIFIKLSFFQVFNVVVTAYGLLYFQGAHIHTYMHTYIHAYMHTRMHTYIHAYMHTCMHTYIWAPLLPR